MQKLPAQGGLERKRHNSCTFVNEITVYLHTALRLLLVWLENKIK